MKQTKSKSFIGNNVYDHDVSQNKIRNLVLLILLVNVSDVSKMSLNFVNESNWIFN